MVGPTVYILDSCMMIGNLLIVIVDLQRRLRKFKAAAKNGQDATSAARGVVGSLQTKH